MFQLKFTDTLSYVLTVATSVTMYDAAINCLRHGVDSVTTVRGPPLQICSADVRTFDLVSHGIYLRQLEEICCWIEE